MDPASKLLRSSTLKKAVFHSITKSYFHFTNGKNGKTKSVGLLPFLNLIMWNNFLPRYQRFVRPLKFCCAIDVFLPTPSLRQTKSQPPAPPTQPKKNLDPEPFPPTRTSAHPINQTLIIHQPYCKYHPQRRFRTQFKIPSCPKIKKSTFNNFYFYLSKNIYIFVVQYFISIFICLYFVPYLYHNR